MFHVSMSGGGGEGGCFSDRGSFIFLSRGASVLVGEGFRKKCKIRGAPL